MSPSASCGLPSCGCGRFNVCLYVHPRVWLSGAAPEQGVSLQRFGLNTMADADTAMDGSASRPSSNGASGAANGAASAAKPAPLASTGDVVGSRLVGAWVPKVGAAGLWLCVRARACMCVCGWVRMWVDASPGMWPCVDARTLSTASMCACKTSCWARWTCSGCVRAFNSACGCYA